MTAPYTLTDGAYLTIIKHLCKYQHAVSGLLLGSATPPLRVTHVLPVAHSALAIGTTPLTETALLLAERRAAQLNLRLIGVYFGNDVADDQSIGVFPTRLADAVRRHFPRACLLMIQPHCLHPDLRMREHCFRVCTMEHGDTGTWGKAAKSKDRLYVSQGALKAAHDMLQGKASVHDLVDFEDHCLDPTTDWFSPTVQLPATSLTPPTS